MNAWRSTLKATKTLKQNYRILRLTSRSVSSRVLKTQRTFTTPTLCLSAATGKQILMVSFLCFKRPSILNLWMIFEIEDTHTHTPGTQCGSNAPWRKHFKLVTCHIVQFCHKNSLHINVFSAVLKSEYRSEILAWMNSPQELLWLFMIKQARVPFLTKAHWHAQKGTHFKSQTWVDCQVI